MSEELKVVITQRQGKTTIGVWAPKCDPVMTIIAGTLEEAFCRIDVPPEN